MFKKKNLLIIFFIGVFILLAYLVIASRFGGKSTTSNLPKPKLSQFQTTGITITSEIGESNFDFPSKLPVIESVSSTLPKTTIDNISNNLGFVGEPNSAEDVVSGTVYFYNNSSNFLTVYPNIRKVKYGPASAPYEKVSAAQNKQLNDKEIIAIAEDYLHNKLSINKDSLKFVETKYLLADREAEVFPETTKENSNVFQINFSPAISKYPVLTSNPLHTTSYVQVLKDGSILNSEVFYPTEYKLSPEEYEILSYDDYITRFQTANLVSLDSSNINLSDITDETEGSIVIESISLAYLLDEDNSSTYQPIFVLTGVASISDYGEGINAVLYLPAYK